MIDDAHRDITWTTTSVAGRAVQYGVGGHGRPLVFLHGWGLSARTYTRALELLAAEGHRVYAPTLPGFGGTAPFAGEPDIRAYAVWVREFVAAVGIDEPFVLVGHSFGGGVGIQFAHDNDGRVAHLILVNSVGGAVRQNSRGVVRQIRDRTLHRRSESARTPSAVPRIIREAVPNIFRNPTAVMQVANLARTADLGAELAELRDRLLQVSIAWSDDDVVIPSSALNALRTALGEPPCVTVSGRHGWLIDQPRLFADVVADVLAERHTTACDIAVDIAVA